MTLPSLVYVMLIFYLKINYLNQVICYLVGFKLVSQPETIKADQPNHLKLVLNHFLSMPLHLKHLLSKNNVFIF